MASDQKTLVVLKSNFLRQQVRTLSQPLRLSEKSQRKANIPEDELREVMLRTNLIVRSHNTAVFDRVGIAQIAQQIESLYWYGTESESLSDGDTSGNEHALRAGDDLANEENIHKLASILDGEDDSSQFSEVLAQLQKLNQRRQTMWKKLDQYRTLQALIEPLSDAREDFQPNLVTKDGPLAEQLARSKFLGIRASGAVTRMGLHGQLMEDDQDIVIVDEAQKVAGILHR